MAEREGKNSNFRLEPCTICGRTFAEDVLERHQKICEKASQKPRNVFDSSKQRSVASDSLPVSKKKPFSNPEKKIKSKFPTHISSETKNLSKKSNWRQQHEDFIRSIRAARGIQEAIKSGKPLPPPAPPSINPDYIQCEYCNRRFNETAAKRHIEFCKSQHERIPRAKAMGGSLAAQKQATRVNYKPPPLKPKKAHSNNYNNYDHYSNNGNFYEDGNFPYNSSSAYSSSKYDSSVYGRGNRNQSSNQSSSKHKTQNLSASSSSSSSNYDPFKTKKYPSSNNLGTIHSSSNFLGRGRGSITKTHQKHPANKLSSSSSYSSNLSVSKFCYECGAQFPTATSKFCCECGSPKC